MFRKHYKAANDDIKPNRGIIEKIFEKAESERHTKKMFRFKAGYGTAAAAVIVLAASMLVYPQFSRINEAPVVVKNTNQIQTENTEIKPTPNAQMRTAENSQTETSNQSAKKDVNAETSKNTSVTDDITPKGEDEKTQTPRSSARLAEIVPNDVCEFTLTDISEAYLQEVEAAQKILFEKFGEVDADTGNVNIFEISGKGNGGNETIYFGRWRWLADGHSSLITEFVLSEDMTEMYECQYTESGTVLWNRSNNLLTLQH